MRHAEPVLLLSRVTGREVRDSGGQPVGRLADLSVRLHTEPPVVERLVVARRDGGVLVLPWTEATFHTDGVSLGVDAGQLSRFEVGMPTDALAADEILLKRDVLDTQIVDVVGQRLTRVADVLLARTPQGRWEALGVDVGFGGVLRRLRLGGARTDAVSALTWSALHLTSERGHQVQLATPRAAVHRLDARGLAALVSRVDTASATEILAGQEPALAAAAVRTAHPDVGEGVLRALPDADSSRIVSAMPAEHAGRWRKRLTRTPARRFLRAAVSARRHLNWPHR